MSSRGCVVEGREGLGLCLPIGQEGREPPQELRWGEGGREGQREGGEGSRRHDILQARPTNVLRVPKVSEVRTYYTRLLYEAPPFLFWRDHLPYWAAGDDETD